MEEIATACDDALYESDFLGWMRRQAELMKARRLFELDLPDVVEEIENSGCAQDHFALLVPTRAIPTPEAPVAEYGVRSRSSRSEEHDAWPEDLL